MKKQVNWLIAVIFVSIAVGCGEDTPLDAAWLKFSDGDYAGAHAEFSVLTESEGAGAYVGLGWTALRMDSLPESDRYFSLVANDSILEAYAGWAILAWLQGQHTLCIERTEFVFRNAGGYETYVFPYDPKITYQDLLVHEGFSYYHNQNFFECINTIQRIDPSFSVALNDANLSTILLARLQLLAEEYN